MLAPWWVLWGGPLLAALISAFLSGYLVTRWKTRQEQIEKRVDELCEAVFDTADLASEYWQGTSADPGMGLREAKIIASVRRIAGLRVMLSDDMSAAAIADMQQVETSFFREVSGGQFGVHNRAADVQRVLSCQFAATELALSARRARLRDLRGLWRRG